VYVESISTDQYNNESFVVEFESDRDGEILNGQTVVGGQRILDFPLDAQWLNIIFALVALVLAFVVGAGIHPAAGAITVSGWAGVAWFIGMVPSGLGAGAIILGMAISVWMMVQQNSTGVP